MFWLSSMPLNYLLENARPLKKQQKQEVYRSTRRVKCFISQDPLHAGALPQPRFSGDWEGASRSLIGGTSA